MSNSRPPTIFNVLVDAVIRHSVIVVVEIEAGAEVLVALVQDLEAYFYTDNGLVALTQSERLKRSFDILTYLFDWFGLWTNVRKKARMEFRTCHTPGYMLEVAYKRQTIEVGTTSWERQRWQVQSPEFRLELAIGSLLAHH